MREVCVRQVLGAADGGARVSYHISEHHNPDEARLQEVSAAGKDTLVAVDSMTLFSLRELESDWHYILICFCSDVN